MNDSLYSNYVKRTHGSLAKRLVMGWHKRIFGSDKEVTKEDVVNYIKKRYSEFADQAADLAGPIVSAIKSHKK